jgi:hypothetical protein
VHTEILCIHQGHHPANQYITPHHDQGTTMQQTIPYLAENLMTEMVTKNLTQKKATNQPNNLYLNN